jgi:hypothetical protein
MKKMRRIALAAVLVAAAGASRAELAADPAGTLAAGLGGSHRQVLSAELTRLFEPEENLFALEYRLYVEELADADEPYLLQPLLGKASWAEIRYDDLLGDASLLTISGRYVFPDTDMGANLGFGYGETGGDESGAMSFFSFGAVYFPADTLTVEGEVKLWDRDGEESQDILVGPRFITPVKETGGTIEAFVAYRSTEDESGVLAEGRYFFGKGAFLGLGFSTDTDYFGATAGYAHEDGFQIEVEYGTDDIVDDYVRLKMGCRF